MQNTDASGSRRGSDEGRAEVVSICLTDEERIEYQKAAERCGLSLAEWICDRLRAVAQREAKEA